MRLRAALLAGSVTLLAGSTSASGSPLIGSDPKLEALNAGYQLQMDVFATLESGLALDTWFVAAELPTVRGFFAQTAQPDFQKYSGKHPFAVVDHFWEYEDVGNFAGIATVGVAARLLWLKKTGASAAELAPARAAAIRAARAWHVYAAIGGKGIVARGIRRVRPEQAGAPSLPGTLPALVPLKDASGAAAPKDKTASWRAPVAAGFDDFIWYDDTSKDQTSGYALAAAWLWDALVDDPEVPAEVPKALADDLGAFARSLMQVAPELGIDLCIRDADGRLTRFHDFNARQLVSDGVLSEDLPLLFNGFNAALALAVIRAAYHVSGDPAIGAYYYQDLVGRRDYPSIMARSSGGVFMGSATNFSNVNMLAIAYATLGRVETDAYVRAKIGEAAEKQFWSTGSTRDVSHVGQAWFDVAYAMNATTVRPELRDRVKANLGSFQPAPAIERDRVNCDDAEIAAGSCLAVDGVTRIELSSGPGHSGGAVAKTPVPMAIRPDTNFEWRSDPHRVNGSGSTLMDHRGDWLAAYWLARLVDLEQPASIVSAKARPPVPYVLGTDEADAGLGPIADAPTESGGGCDVGAAPSGSIVAIATAAAALAARRRRRTSRGSPGSTASRSSAACANGSQATAERSPRGRTS